MTKSSVRTPQPPLINNNATAPSKANSPTFLTQSQVRLAIQRIQAGRRHPVQMQQDILVLQQTIGNRAVVQLLAQVQKQGKPNNEASIHAIASAGVQGTGSKLPHYDKIQAAFGQHDISHVQAYTGNNAAAASRAISAQAYATENKIAFAGRNPDLFTAAHEAAHIIQQREDLHLKEGVGTAGDKYEQQADLIANRVVQGKSAESELNAIAANSANELPTTDISSSNTVQLRFTYKGEPLSDEAYCALSGEWLGKKGFIDFIVAKRNDEPDYDFLMWLKSNSWGLSDADIDKIVEIVTGEKGSWHEEFSTEKQREPGDSNIFGLSGKNLEQIMFAINIGYRKFDAADTYYDKNDENIWLLAEAIKSKKGLKRRDFEIIYKVDKTPTKELEAHLIKVANALGNYIDHVIIHKVANDSAQTTIEKFETLYRLKNKGSIQNVGAGDVGAKVDQSLAPYINHADSYEISAEALFNKDSVGLINQLKQSKKPVFIYNILQTLTNVLKIGNPTEYHLSAITSFIRNKIPTADPILSSRDTRKIMSNKKITEEEYTYDAKTGEAYTEIEQAIEKRFEKPVISKKVADIPQYFKKRLETLMGKYKWNDKFCENDQKYKELLDQEMFEFTQKELETYLISDEKEMYSLKTLMENLFCPDLNCTRVGAFNFLQNFLGGGLLNGND